MFILRLWRWISVTERGTVFASIRDLSLFFLAIHKISIPVTMAMQSKAAATDTDMTVTGESEKNNNNIILSMVGLLLFYTSVDAFFSLIHHLILLVAVFKIWIVLLTFLGVISSISGDDCLLTGSFIMGYSGKTKKT